MKQIWLSSALIGVCLLASLSLQGCGLAAVGAAGAAGGYEASQHGYEVQSPVTHKNDQAEQDSSQQGSGDQ